MFLNYEDLIKQTNKQLIEFFEKDVDDAITDIVNIWSKNPPKLDEKLIDDIIHNSNVKIYDEGNITRITLLAEPYITITIGINEYIIKVVNERLNEKSNFETSSVDEFWRYWNNFIIKDCYRYNSNHHLPFLNPDRLLPKD